MKKIYLVPNFVTTANMFSGFYSIVASNHRDYSTAAWAILAAGVFDMLDGRIARLAKATSQFGLEYDSLSDLLSFGVAPAILLYQWALEPYDRLGWIAAFLYWLAELSGWLGSILIRRLSLKIIFKVYRFRWPLEWLLISFYLARRFTGTRPRRVRGF